MPAWSLPLMTLLQVVVLVVLHVNADIGMNLKFWRWVGLISGAGSVSTVVPVRWAATRDAAASGSLLALESVALVLCCLTISVATTPEHALARR